MILKRSILFLALQASLKNHVLLSGAKLPRVNSLTSSCLTYNTTHPNVESAYTPQHQSHFNLNVNKDRSTSDVNAYDVAALQYYNYDCTPEQKHNANTYNYQYWSHPYEFDASNAPWSEYAAVNCLADPNATASSLHHLNNNNVSPSPARVHPNYYLSQLSSYGIPARTYEEFSDYSQQQQQQQHGQVSRSSPEFQVKREDELADAPVSCQRATSYMSCGTEQLLAPSIRESTSETCAPTPCMASVSKVENSVRFSLERVSGASRSPCSVEDRFNSIKEQTLLTKSIKDHSQQPDLVAPVTFQGSPAISTSAPNTCAVASDVSVMFSNTSKSITCNGFPYFSSSSQFSPSQNFQTSPIPQASY